MSTDDTFVSALRQVAASTPPAPRASKAASARSLIGTSEPIAFFHAGIVERLVKPATNLRKNLSALGGT